MSENIRPIIKNTLSQVIPDDSIRQKMTQLISALKNTANNIGNDWNSKEREDFIYNQVTSLDFIKSGDFILRKKPCVDKLKVVYNSLTPTQFTTVSLTDYFDDIDVNSIYVLKEPFGSKASPDFLFITSKGIIGVEDKSSKNGKVTFNTGTPGGNKFIMYYDRVKKNIHLVTGKQWGWESNIDKEYKEFTKEMIDYAKNAFEQRFGDRLKKMSYYARPMLVDKNKIDDIRDNDEQDVMDMLGKYL